MAPLEIQLGWRCRGSFLYRLCALHGVKQHKVHSATILWPVAHRWRCTATGSSVFRAATFTARISQQRIATLTLDGGAMKKMRKPMSATHRHKKKRRMLDDKHNHKYFDLIFIRPVRLLFLYKYYAQNVKCTTKFLVSLQSASFWKRIGLQPLQCCLLFWQLCSHSPQIDRAAKLDTLLLHRTQNKTTRQG